jgi:hypothetical protein
MRRPARAAPPPPRCCWRPIVAPARTSLRLLPLSRSLGRWAHNLQWSSADPQSYIDTGAATTCSAHTHTCSGAAQTHKVPDPRLHVRQYRDSKHIGARTVTKSQHPHSSTMSFRTHLSRTKHARKILRSPHTSRASSSCSHAHSVQTRDSRTVCPEEIQHSSNALPCACSART